jgi:hypothetical protein
MWQDFRLNKMIEDVSGIICHPGCDLGGASAGRHTSGNVGSRATQHMLVNTACTHPSKDSIQHSVSGETTSYDVDCITAS